MNFLFIFFVMFSMIACEKKKIASEYPAEMSAVATPGEGLPFLVGKDLRPVWETKDAPKTRELLPFQFVDQAGKKITLDETKGKIAIVSFFFSKCPGTCPITTSNLKKIQDKFKNNNRV